MIHHITLDELYFIPVYLSYREEQSICRENMTWDISEKERTLSQYLCKKTRSLLIGGNQSLNCIADHWENCNWVLMKIIFPPIFFNMEKAIDSIFCQLKLTKVATLSLHMHSSPGNPLQRKTKSLHLMFFKLIQQLCICIQKDTLTGLLLIQNHVDFICK